MKTLIGLVVIFCVCFLPGIIANYKFDHRLPPEGYRTDYGAMNRDMINGMSKMDAMRKANNGGYNVKK